MRRRLALFAAIAMLMVPLAPSAAFAAVAGAIFTTNEDCNGTNVNIFGSKEIVWLDGGPVHEGAAGLPDGSYYVKVTEPNGTLLGYSTTAVAVVSGGEFTVCYNLWDVLVYPDGLTPGYATTTNNGCEYKVWVSQDSTFPNNLSKTDNFKVCEGDEPETAELNVIKFYDANANGLNDDGQPIVGWRVEIEPGGLVRFTPASLILAPDTYTVTESTPLEANWIATTPNPVLVTVAANESKTVEFGNLCLGAGGGKTLGFWSNKNGQALFGADDLALMVALNLRSADGSHFDPASYAAFRTWLLGANATNMANMLSAQLAAMELNVLNGKVAAGSLVYAPGATSANALGFATIGALMAEADAELGAHGLTTSASADAAFRPYQDALKNALDDANNNLNFVQPTPCAFTFAE